LASSLAHLSHYLVKHEIHTGGPLATSPRSWIDLPLLPFPLLPWPPSTPRLPITCFLPRCSSHLLSHLPPRATTGSSLASGGPPQPVFALRSPPLACIEV